MYYVIKIGGSVAEQHRSLSSLFKELSLQARSSLVVHGGGSRVTALSRRLGIEPRFVDGVRRTSDQEMEIVDMVLAGAVNTQLVRHANGVGLNAIGLSGADARLITGRRLDGSRTATVDRVDATPIFHLWNGGYTPIIAPVGSDETDGPVNINADESARAIARTLGKNAPVRLCYLSDVEGVLDRAKRRIDSITLDEIEPMIADGTIAGGMIAKLRSAADAVRAGVESVHIGTYASTGDLAAIVEGRNGTRIISNG